MSIGMRIVNGLLLALLLAAGVATAQTNDTCPECDSDGTNSSSSYSSIDLGAITEHEEVLGDTDVSLGDTYDERGFWAWLSVCLSLFVDRLEGILGVEIDVDGNVEAYVSEGGVDLDASLVAPGEACDALAEAGAESATAPLGDDGNCAFSFDRSDVGDLDGQTWEVLGEAGVDVPVLPVGGEHVPEGIDYDLCLFADLSVATCG